MKPPRLKIKTFRKQKTSGPDGNLWFTEAFGNALGKITTAGVITEFPIPTAGSGPSDIIVGPDGNLWFTECNCFGGLPPGGNKIGKITIAGTITEFPLPSANSGPNGIAAGADGNLWFTEENANQIGKITITGVITEYPVPTPSSQPYSITAGPDGNLWFTEENGNKVAKITTNSPSPYQALIQQPINSDGTSVFNAKRGVIPVKFTLNLNGVATCQLPAATISLARAAGGTTGAIDETLYLQAADNGLNFRISGCQYVYNLTASSLGSGAYRVDITINGAVAGSGVFALK